MKIGWYDFGSTKVRGYEGTRIDSSRTTGRAIYSRTPEPPYPRTPELNDHEFHELN